MTTYNADIDYGQGGDTQIEAGSLQEACEKAAAWAKDGDYSEALDRDGGCTILVRVWPIDWDDFSDAPEDVRDESHLDITTPEPECPEATEHDWTSEFEGGCSENPGCWDLGNGRMKFVSHCRTCGMERTRISLYASGNSLACAGVPDETVCYSDADPDWVAAHITD
jgi:hypothetical protein